MSTLPFDYGILGQSNENCLMAPLPPDVGRVPCQILPFDYEFRVKLMKTNLQLPYHRAYDTSHVKFSHSTMDQWALHVKDISM